MDSPPAGQGAVLEVEGGLVSDIWDDVSGDVAYALAFDLQHSLEYFDADAVLMSVDAREDDPTKVDVRKRFLRVFAAERAFVRHVWSVVAPLTRGGNVVVLFDIDQTLGSRKGRPGKEGKPGESATLVRPAAAPLMARLHGAGVVMGILTTRGITDIRANLADALHLKGVAPYIDPAHLTAAEMPEHASTAATTSSDEIAEEVFAKFRHLLAPAYAELPAFRSWRDFRGRPLPVKDIDKLLQLATTVEDHREQLFVVVDDRDYAGLLAGPDARAVGVHLPENERAHF
jgi:hypothetical protein